MWSYSQVSFDSMKCMCSIHFEPPSPPRGTFGGPTDPVYVSGARECPAVANPQLTGCGEVGCPEHIFEAFYFR